MYIGTKKHTKGEKVNCLKCASERLKTIQTTQCGGTTKRIKQCKECDFIFPTLEKPYFENYATQEEVEEYAKYIDETSSKIQK